ncbi:MAG TPA: phosphatidylglycerol lysyltransferase domain-containing protein, partial [Thermomicrobiales bacterium]|nr:phosphatidylglycerol lysyltransferase domain-containing protein [Thermomicrobiales bacterium]
IHVSGGLGVAAAGYVVGSIFLLVSPILQGIGLVEVSMTVILQRLGLSSSEALGTTLLYRMGDTWGPLAIGIALQIRAREALQKVPRNFPAIFTGVTGLFSVLSVLAPRVPHHLNRLEDYSFASFVDGSRTSSLIAGTLLLTLSVALWRRRLTAWWCAVVLLGLLILTHIGKRHDQVLAMISALNLALLLITRNRFRVRSDIPTLRRGIMLFISSLIFAVAYGTFGFWLLDRREFGIDFSVWRSVQETLRLFFSLGDTDLTPHTRYARWFLDSVSVVGVMALTVATISLLRPVVWRRRTHPAEREEARRLIALHGRSALDAFKVDDDKLFFFAADRQAVISFGVANGVAVALGDPTAVHATSFQQVLAEFLDFCDANAWQAAFHQVPPDHLDDYRNAGMSILKLGEEAIVELGNWSLAGNSMKGLRSAVNRIEREGYSAVIHEPPLNADLITRLRNVSDAWLTLPGRRERV